MQEEIEQKTMTLSINATKFSGRVLKAAITKYLAHRSAKKHERQREKTDVIPHGKQKVKELIGQNAGVANVDVKDEDLKGFERIARKYGVDYAVKRVKGQDKYLVFFKARDADALTAAFNEYSAKVMNRSRKPSVLKQLRSIASKIAELPGRVVNRDKQREQSR